MTEFTPWLSLLGGALIGVAAVLLMALHGRIAGMTGIIGGLMPVTGDWGWRVAFLLGAIAAPTLMIGLGGIEIPFESPAPMVWTVISGLLVGVGVVYGGGCTSGHGICGNARLSPRSLVATAIFMLASFATVFVIRHLLGGF